MAHDVHNPDGHDDHAATVRAYLIVFGCLAFFTFCSFAANFIAAPEHAWISKSASFVIIMMVSVAKASLVGWIFMHLKFDWRKLYFMIVPAFILGTMMMMVFLPDMVLAWQR
jgi:caa(3)-type oxidase subunit IV